MTDDVKTEPAAAAAAAPEAVVDPMEKAKANGYVEPEPPSKEERIAALVHYVEHAHKHNSPMSMHMIHEMKDLLGYQAITFRDEPKADVKLETKPDAA